jgi:ribonuclease VapC
MVIDTSAVVAILLGEIERDDFIAAMASDPVRLMSAINAPEASIVIEARKGPSGGREFDLFLHRAQVAIVPLQPEPYEEARAAWRNFGNGNHLANLNLCDCCSYALSRLSGEPLLYKGQDFARTDITNAIRREDGAERIVEIVLQKTYYQQGFLNIPVEHDKLFGSHHDKIDIFLEEDANSFDGVINRTAQRNGTARVLGHSQLRDYFRSRFRPGDSVFVVVESPQKIRLRSRR